MVARLRWSFVVLAIACRPDPAATTSVPVVAEPPAIVETPAAVEPAPTPAPDPKPVAVRDAESDALWQQLAADAPAVKWTVLGKYGAARFEKHGDVVVDGAQAPAFDDVPVIEPGDDRMRVKATSEAGDVALLVWIDVAEVAPQLQRVAMLHDRAGQKLRPGDGAMELAPGELLEVLDRKGAWARVRTSDDGFTGWLEAAALGAVYEPKPFEVPAVNALTMPGTTIAMRPGGPALHKLGPLEGSKHNVRVLGKKSGGWLEIEWVDPCDPGIRVHGYVRAKTTEMLGPDLVGYGCGFGMGPGRVQWGVLARVKGEQLAAHTELLTKDGKLIGRTLREAELRRDANGVLHTATRWGLVPVFVR